MKRVLVLSIFVVLGLNAANLEDKVAVESVSHKNRIAVLAEAEKCIQNAKTKEEYKQCEKMEKEGRKKNKEELFEIRKANMIKKLDARILKIEETKRCIANAQNKEDVKNCRPKKVKK